MLTPIVSKKQKKKNKQKCGSGRDIAKELILRREFAPAGTKPPAPAATPAQVTSVPPANDNEDGKLNPAAFTDDELVKLDTLYDIVSWLVYLYSGDYTKMNESGDAVGFKPMTAEAAAAVKAKLQGKITELVSNIDKVIDKSISANEPIVPTAVSDIKNQIEVLT